MAYTPATRLKVLKPFMCRGETVPANAYLGPAQIRAVQRKLHVLLSNGTLQAVPDTYDRVAQEDPQPTYLNPKHADTVSAGDLLADFDATATYLSFAFDASGSSVTAPRTVTDWEWDFGDGTAKVTETDGSATHVYAAPGTYPVSLVVADDWDRRSFAKVASVDAYPELAAAFTNTPTLLSVAFDASTSAGDGDIVSYTWDFGDGSDPETNATATTTYVYDAADTYTVTLTVTDEWGFTDDFSDDVTVAAA
jgi:PKD repeat protein